MKNTAKMTPSPNEGDFVTSITGSGNAGMTLIGSSSTAIRYRKVGQAYGLKSEASWHAMSDTVNPQPAQDRSRATFYLLIHTPAVMAQRLLWMDRVFRLKVNANGEICWGGGANGGFGLNTIQNWMQSGLLMQPDTTYIIEGVYTREPGKTLHSRLIKVDDNTIQVGVGVSWMNHTTMPNSDDTYNIYLSSAQTGWLNFWFGDLIVYNTDNQNVREVTINYLKALYHGNVTVTGQMCSSLKLCSEELGKHCDGHMVLNGRLGNAFETLVYKGALTTTEGIYNMDHRPQRRTCHKFRLKDLDISFRKPDHTIAEVTDFSIQLAMEENPQSL